MTILFFFSNIFLSFFKNQSRIHCYFFTLVFYLVLSIMVNCFLIKYYIPFSFTLFYINIKRTFTFLIINIFFFVYFNSYSLVFILLNVCFSLKQIKNLDFFYLFNLYYSLILIFEYLNINYFIQFFLCTTLVIFISFFKDITYIKTIIFYIVFILLHSFKFIKNEILKYEFNEKGLLITLLNYSILFSMLIIDN